MSKLLQIFSIFFFVFIAGAAYGNDEILTKATKKYDEIVNEYQKLKGRNENAKADEESKITREDYNALKKKIDEALDLFDQYMRIGTDDGGKKAARHYSVVLKQYDFIMKNDLKEFKSNYAAIPDIEKDLEIIQGYYYPINYRSDGKNYIIDFEKRSNIERNLLVEFTETCTNLGKSEDATKYGKKASSYYKLGDYNLWWTAHIWYFHADKLHRRDADMVEAAEKVIFAMSGLKRSDIKKIKDSNWVNYTHAYAKLNTLLASMPELSRGGEVWAQAGENFEKLEEDKWAAEYYKKALDAGYGDKDFLLKMMEKGKQKSDKTLVQTALDIYESRNLYSTYWCSDYQTIAGYYRYVDNDIKANELDAKYKTCVKEQDKQQRRAERGARFFISFAPLAPISGNLQGSIQIGTRKRLHEFGVKQTNEQKDRGLDFSLGNSSNKKPDYMVWSGMSFYYTNKKILSEKSRSSFYLGFQLRYTDKKYEQQTAFVRSTSGGLSQNLSFNPTEKRYDLTLQIGNILAGKYLHMEMYYGFGVGYSVFNGGRSEWNNESFEITNHDFLSQRKETRLGVTFRLGLMIGLNLVNK